MITAKFSIKNKGGACITFDVLTVGGRLDGIVKDFEWKRDIELPPHGVYHYQGKLKPEEWGNYQFFTAYRTTDGQWNTAISTAEGVTNTKDIVVNPSAGKPKKLTGFVRDQHGNPIENATVWFGNYLRVIEQAETDQKGYFEIPLSYIVQKPAITEIFRKGNYDLAIIKGIDTNHWYALKRTDLYEPYTRKIDITEKRAKAGIFLGVITIRKWYRILGRVVIDPAQRVYWKSWLGLDLAVAVFEPDSSTPSAMSRIDEEGHFVTSPLPDGKYRLVVWLPFWEKITEREIIIAGNDVDLGEIVIPKK